MKKSMEMLLKWLSNLKKTGMSDKLGMPRKPVRFLRREPSLVDDRIHAFQEKSKKEKRSEAVFHLSGVAAAGKNSGSRVTEEEYTQAVEDCRRAMMEWKTALHKLDWVTEPDQIDYAIYSVIAAEKHYTTLLKETKRLYGRLTENEAKVGMM